MPTCLTRSVLIVLTIVGLLMPRISGAVAFAAPGVQTLVICTGTGLQTIRIDANGKPVPVAEHGGPCLLAQAADTAVRVELAPGPAPMVDRLARPTGELVRLDAGQAARPPPRGPPAA